MNPLHFFFSKSRHSVGFSANASWINMLCSGLLMLLVSTSALAQDVIKWSGETYREQSDFLIIEGQRGEDPINVERIWFTADGHDSIARWTAGDTMEQTVTNRYDSSRLLVERVIVHKGEEMRFTWKYKKDDQGRLVDEMAFDQEEKLISQQIFRYDDVGRIIEHATFVQKDFPFELWRFENRDGGFFIQDATYMPIGRGYFHYNWSTQQFYRPIEAFTPVPIEAMFLRYTKKFNDKGELRYSYKFDQFGNQIEETMFKYNELGQLRSGLSTVAADSSQIIWDYIYDNGGNLTEVASFTAKDGRFPRYQATYTYGKNAQVESLKTYQVGMVRDDWEFGKDGKPVRREVLNVFNELVEVHLYEKGRIVESTYIDGETQEPYLYRTYRYE